MDTKDIAEGSYWLIKNKNSVETKGTFGVIG